MVVDLRVEIALHDILFVVPIVCACPAAWGVGNLHQTAAVEEEPCPSAVGSMSPGAVDLVEEKAFDRFRRLVSVEAAVFDSELLCHRVGQFFYIVRHFSKMSMFYAVVCCVVYGMSWCWLWFHFYLALMHHKKE